MLVEQFNGDERGLEVDRCGKGYGRIVAGQQARDMSSLYKRSGCRVRNFSNSTARDRKGPTAERTSLDAGQLVRDLAPEEDAPLDIQESM